MAHLRLYFLLRHVRPQFGRWQGPFSVLNIWLAGFPDTLGYVEAARVRSNFVIVAQLAMPLFGAYTADRNLK